MAKKDTYLALLRRGIDETTAMQLADAGIKIGDLKKIDKSQLVENYGCLLYTSPSPRDKRQSRMPSSA